MEKNRSKGLHAILFLIFVFFIIFIAFGVYTFSIIQNKSGNDIASTTGPKDAAVAVVDVKGVIMESRDTVDLLMSAEKDEAVKAIIVRVDSPGGAVGPTQEIYEEIRRIDAVKPVYASFGSIAASGGYYIGAAARKIFANAGTLTGSIGVLMQFVDISKLYEWAKINPTIVKGGHYKDMGNPARGLTVEEKELLQGLIGSVHQQFRNDILKVRKEQLKKVDITSITQGQIFSGEQALQLGLVDELGGLRHAARTIYSELKLPGECKLKILKKKKDFSFGEILNNVDESVAQIKERIILNKVPLLLYQQ